MPVAHTAPQLHHAALHHAPDPQPRLPRARSGVSMGDIIGGLQAAIDEAAAHPTAPVDAKLIFCIVRTMGELAAAQVRARTRACQAHA